jgi:hypothetical protein
MPRAGSTAVTSPLVISGSSVGDSLESVNFSLTTVAPLEFFNPPGVPASARPGSPFWAFIPGDDVPEQVDNRAGWDISACFNQHSCTVPLKSRLFSRYFRQAAGWNDVAFLDAGAFIECSPLDGIHFESGAHRILGLALANEVRNSFS